MAKTSRSATPRKKTASKATGRKTPGRKAPAGARAARAEALAIQLGPDTAREQAMAIAHLALEKKALDVVVLDVRGLASYADYFVVMTAESDPQLNAIADHIETKMKEQGERPIGVEGARAGQWVLVDYGNIVAHVFYQDMRSFYDIEGLWADAPRIEVRD